MCTSCFSEEVEYLVCATGSSKVKIWNLKDVTNISCVLSFMPHNNEILHTVSSKTDKLLISAEDKTVTVWNVHLKDGSLTTKRHACFRGHSSPVKGIIPSSKKR